jgi:hypothetical protein
MVHYSHPEVQFIPYSEKIKGDVLLGINSTHGQIKSKIRRIVHVGSVPTFMKSKRRVNIDKVDHIFFNSEFCKKIINSSIDFKSVSSFLVFGCLPADTNMEPLNGPRSIDGPIQFLALAKWFKRPYKRLKQIETLFNKYLKKEYPDSVLNVVGTRSDSRKGDICYYKKSSHNEKNVEIVKNSHIQLIPTPFDTGPKTIPESLHYRIPFVCSNNCAGKEYIKKLGKCGIEVQTDPQLYVIKQYLKYRPLDSGSEYNRKKIPYEEYLKAVRKIANNFEEYTSWEWNDKLNYKKQSDNLYKILKG